MSFARLSAWSRWGHRPGSGVGAPFSPPSPIPPGTPAPLLAVEANGEFAQWDGTPPADPADLINYVVTVTEDGYSSTGTATTHTEGFYVGLRVRQPYPNQASLSADRVALGFHIYENAVVNGGSATNNSTLVSPRPFFQWVDYGFRVIGNTHRPKAFAAHIRGIACVKYIYSDGTNTVEAIATNLVREISPCSGLAVMYYDPGEVNISSLTASQLITLRAIAYPRIGTQAYDTADFTEVHDQTNLYFRRNLRVLANPPIAYLDSVAGSDATGVVSTDDAVARANPFATWGATSGGAAQALAAFNNAAGTEPFNGCDGGIVRVVPGSSLPLLNSVSRNQRIAAVIFEKHPDTVGYQDRPNGGFNPRLTGKDAAVPCQSVIFRGFRLRVTSNTNFFATTSGWTTRFIVDDCEMDFSAATSSGAFGGANDGTVWVKDSTYVTSMSNNYLVGANGRVVQHVGCRNTVHWGSQRIIGQLHGCHWLGGAIESAGVSHQFLLVNTVLQRSLEAVNPSVTAGHLGTRGACIVNFAAEDCSSAEHVFIRLAADGFVGNTNHVLIWHASVAGFDGNCRSNLAYNDTFGVNNLHQNWSMIGYINQGRVPSKTDTFALDGNAVGNWGVIFGVSCRGNFIGRAPTTVGIFEYLGRNSVNPGQNRSIINDPMWLDNKASTDAGGTPTAGGTDYELHPDSPARGIVENSPVQWDLFGNARATTGFVAAGALV